MPNSWRIIHWTSTTSFFDFWLQFLCSYITTLTICHHLQQVHSINLQWKLYGTKINIFFTIQISFSWLYQRREPLKYRVSSNRRFFGCFWYHSIDHVQLCTIELLMLVRRPTVASVHEQLWIVSYERLTGWLWLVYFLWWVPGDSIVTDLLARDIWSTLGHSQ